MSRSRAQQLRLHIAREAARILVESGSQNFSHAKRKAVERLRVTETRNLPNNQEILQALAEYQRLFRSDTQPAHLRNLRSAGVEAMGFLTEFEPRLVGAVLDGTADRHSEVNLHLFSDHPERIATFLHQRGIPFQLTERRLRMGRDQVSPKPEYRFLAGDVQMALTIFDHLEKAHPPFSPVDGRPMRRATLAEARALLESDNG